MPQVLKILKVWPDAGQIVVRQRLHISWGAVLLAEGHHSLAALVIILLMAAGLQHQF